VTDSFQVDLPTCNALLSTFPTENRYRWTIFYSILMCSFRTKSLFDAIWPVDTVQSECAMGILQRMEEGFVIPQASTYDIIFEVKSRIFCELHITSTHFTPSSHEYSDIQPGPARAHPAALRPRQPARKKVSPTCVLAASLPLRESVCTHLHTALRRCQRAYCCLLCCRYIYFEDRIFISTYILYIYI
jgi:hypothetical protein